mgnify:FL=1|jgi:phosphodiesterase/alkaline phosphatase D-like protein
MKLFLVFLTPAALLHAAPIPLVNPGGELNNGTDRTLVSDPSVLGWEGTGQVINDRTDYGNGGWRLTFEDGTNLSQTTTHLIETGASYSLRFDAAIFADGAPSGDFTPDLTLIEPGLLNGDFNEDTSTVDSRTFADTPLWSNLGSTGQPHQATRFKPANTSLDGSRNAVIAANEQRRFAIDSGHTLAEGEVFQASYQWRDAFNWNDATNRIRVTLFTTDADLITGAASIIQTLDSDLSSIDATYETQNSIFSPIPAAAAGKRLFASFQAINGGGGFSRVENFTLQRGNAGGNAGGAPVERNFTAEFIVDNDGAPEVIATRTFDFKSNSVASWHHYNFAIQPGTLDAHAGKAFGIRFRSTPTEATNYQSVDNVRLDFWSTDTPTGHFSIDWDNTPNQVWPGPGFWGNRLHDWQVNNGRVNCILGSRDRRTLHKVDTTLRGNGENFSLSVRTGRHAGTLSSSARTGFLLGAGPGLDWRGSLLVHDGLGRDFGIFVGLRGDGRAVIEDLSKGGTNTLATGGTPASFPADARLDLTATYLPARGRYQLSLSVFDPANNPISTASAEVDSAQLLGSLGLLSHKGGNNARFWFDEFSGTGTALNSEPDRHLAIVGAMYTLSRQTLKLTAQFPPLDLASTPPVRLETKDGDDWNEISNTTIDNTDSLSSYTTTFKIPNWDDTRDTDFRITVEIDNAPYSWTGIIRKNPVDQAQITLAATTCQRITDGRIQDDGFDWSPVRLWQPNTLAFTNLVKHDPDVFLALGDQIYEGQPTPEDSGNDFNRHHDYLYKWYLWVLQARDVTRIMPTICIPDDHDVYQGNLWGEGGIATNSQNSGGYEEPANWVKMLERTQTSHLPETDPYNPVQPAPPVAQGIPPYFTGMIYGDVGFAILEDRKFKTGKDNPPADLNQQFLLGTRQKDFLRAWANDWDDQTVKCVISQSPFGNIHTHANSGYGFGLNDRDTHGWPTHRRNEVWELLRKTRMFQIAGDQHLATFAHHGIKGPADAGFSYTAPAIGNFFPRAWDPIHNSAGRIDAVNPYKGDFFFDGNGTLPWGQPNLTSAFPHHVRVLGAGNPHQYHNQTRNISPANLHDRGAGYGIVRIEKNSRQITFETWPLHADPDYPNTGSQFDDWPITISQTDNDGRIPTGFLPLIDSGYQLAPVLSVYNESTGELVYSIRTRDNLVRPPVYDNTVTYRVVIENGFAPITLENQTPLLPEPPAINSFRALEPRISTRATATLRWDVNGAETLTINGEDVLPFTVDGIGFLQVSPGSDTTYSLTLNGTTTGTAIVLVFNEPEPVLSISSAAEDSDASFTSLIPLDTRIENFVIEQSPDLMTWTELGSENTTRKITGSNVTLTLAPFYIPSSPTNFYRAGWR